MQTTKFKAVTVVAADTWCHTALAEAFNLWAMETQPAAILHVHFYHDLSLRVRGYQIIYEDSRGTGVYEGLAQAIAQSTSSA